VRSGDPISLDAGHAAVYAGQLWRGRPVAPDREAAVRAAGTDLVRRRLLALTLHDPSSIQFRPSRCQSVHDVIRYCHEKGIEAMFSLNERELTQGASRARLLVSSAPINLHVLDLGGGATTPAPGATRVMPDEIVSRPFRALWRGITHPGVTWRREMPASFSGLMSVVAGSLGAGAGGPHRALGEKSYLLITSDFMDLNSRLAYHFTVVDATVGATAAANSVFFRFAGGAAVPWRRNLRAGFLEACLAEHGFHVDRRGDLINAWFKNAGAAETEARLDVLGRLMACSSQLDMYMSSESTMRWYVEQFLSGNYAFAGQPR
jgi:pyruvate,water dikinase